jgi:hypothetical protein
MLAPEGFRSCAVEVGSLVCCHHHHTHTHIHKKNTHTSNDPKKKLSRNPPPNKKNNVFHGIISMSRLRI